MGPWVPAAIAAGASMIGGLIQNRGQRDAAREQMKFQADMANTSYRRARTDLESAGYSPYLAYSQGGATSPGGAQATVSDVIGPAVSSAMSANRMRSELALVDKQRDNAAKAGDMQDYENARLRYLYGIDDNNVPKDSALFQEKLTAIANRRAAEANASAAEWENTDARRYQRILFGNQGYVPGIGSTVGDVISNLMPFGRFKNAQGLIRGIGSGVRPDARLLNRTRGGTRSQLPSLYKEY